MLLSCLSERMGFAALMELTQRAPTDDEVDRMVPCFSEAESTSAGDVPEASAKEYAPAPTAPDGIPWYSAPLFDSHMHMVGLTISLFGDCTTSEDVLRIRDRNDIKAGVGFYLPTVTGRRSEADLVLGRIKELDDRLVAIFSPPPFDFGLNFGFLEFSEGDFTTSLLEPWYPAQGPLDGFGEITFYTDHFSSSGPRRARDERRLSAGGRILRRNHDSSAYRPDRRRIRSDYRPVPGDHIPK